VRVLHQALGEALHLAVAPVLCDDNGGQFGAGFQLGPGDIHRLVEHGAATELRRGSVSFAFISARTLLMALSNHGNGRWEKRRTVWVLETIFDIQGAARRRPMDARPHFLMVTSASR
jgi:hypothetical protein